MAQLTDLERSQGIAVGVDACRVRLVEGQPTTFLDARRRDHWDASASMIAGAVRLAADVVPIRLPCPKHNYIVVYCA